MSSRREMLVKEEETHQQSFPQVRRGGEKRKSGLSLLLHRLIIIFAVMGIRGLTRLLKTSAPKCMIEQKLESYAGREIAIDASMTMYQFLIVVGRNGTGMLTNDSGKVTSHLQGMLSRTVRLLEAGLKPVYVFDGEPPELKKQELAKRNSKRLDATQNLAAAIESGDKIDIEKFSKRTVKVTQQQNQDCKELLKLMGVPVVQAFSEAEVECAALCESGKVYAVASEDMDTLTFGTPRFLRHLMDPASKKVPVVEYEVAKILVELNLTMDQFIDMCILCGCDYCDSIPGIGERTALKLIHKHGSLESILENINKERYQIPENWPYNEVRNLFKEPLVSADDQQPDLNWTGPDEEGLITFLVEENGFNYDRVTKAIERIKVAKGKSFQVRSESFFKPAVSTVASHQKESKCILGAPSAALRPRMFSFQVCTQSRPKFVGNSTLPTLDLGIKQLKPFSSSVCLGV